MRILLFWNFVVNISYVLTVVNSNQFIFWITCRYSEMLFYSFFKSMVGKEVVVELKNDVCIHGTLHSVDQYLNMNLQDTRVSHIRQYIYVCEVFFSFHFALHTHV